MGITADKSELEATTLLVIQEAQAAFQQACRGHPGARFLLVITGVRPLRELGDENGCRPLVAQEVNSPVTCYRDHPSHRTPAGRLELRRSLPDAHEHVLQRLFGKRTPP